MQSVPKDLIDFFGRDPWGPLFALEPVISDDSHVMHRRVHEALSAYDHDELNILKAADPEGLSHYRHISALGRSEDLELRAWALTSALLREIPRERLRCLTAPGPRPPPLNQDALADVTTDADGLVRLNQFSVGRYGLYRNGHVFMGVAPVQSANSAYWYMQKLGSHPLRDVISLRLDPLQHWPEGLEPRAEYRALWYGLSLDWDRIASLKETEHGRWGPDALSIRDLAFTDYAWSPRGSEVHLQIEEVPRMESIAERGSRYLHAVYSLAKEQIIHFDAALRIYSAAEWVARSTLHVRNAGKIGTRTKVFRFDAPVDRQLCLELAGSFFVWNMDLAGYLSAPPNRS